MKQRLGWITALALLVAMTVAFGLAAIIDSLWFRSFLVNEATVQAQVAADNVAAALRFQDAAVGNETLAALKASPDILQAFVVDSGGRTFAGFERGDETPSILQASVRCPVRFAGENIGRVELRVSLMRIPERVLGLVVASAISGLLAMVPALLLVGRLQKSITLPLSQLVEAMGSVSRTQQYSVRLPVVSRDEVGELTSGFNAMLSDIQARDLRLARYRDDLEQAVQERTADLRVAKEAAESASHAKSDFLATISHEIRTPINGVLGLTDLLLRTPLEETQRRFVTLAKASGEHLLALISEVLDFSKIEAGKLELHPSRTHVGRVVEEVAQAMALQAEAKGLQLHCDVEPACEHRATQIDALRLRQILVNLVGNAVKFTAAGSVTIRARVRDDDGSDQYLIEVIDTGPGIPEAMRPRLFQPFTQADSSLRREFGGTGLGLAIAKRLARLLGGDIGFDSPTEGGSRFWLWFPDAPLSASGPITTLNAAVWVAIESTPIRESVEKMLKAWRVRRVTSPDAAPSAIRVLEGRHVDEMAPGGATVVIAGPSAPVPAGAQHVRTPVRYSDLLDALMRASGAKKADPSPTAVSTDILSGRVLLVDDNLVNRLVAKAWLEAFGLTVDEAGDGVAAIEALRPDHRLVLMDCQMPKLDGLGATRRIRERESATDRVPIVAVTANAFAEDRERALAAGMDDYLVKPFTRESLLGVVRRWLGEGSARPEASNGSAPADSSALPDWRQSLRLLLGPEASLLSVVDAFTNDCSVIEAGLIKATADEDPAETTRLLHKLKGAISAFGPSPLATRITQIHQAVRGGAIPTAATLSELATALEAFRAELRRLAAER